MDSGPTEGPTLDRMSMVQSKQQRPALQGVSESEGTNDADHEQFQSSQYLIHTCKQKELGESGQRSCSGDAQDLEELSQCKISITPVVVVIP